MKHWFLPFLVLLICVGCKSQSVTQINSLKYRVNAKDYSVMQFKVRNTLKEPLMIWFHSPDKSHDIKKYFSIRKDDFSLSTLIYEGLLKDTNMTIGKDFLKILPGGKEFMIFILSEVPIKENSIEDCITIVKQSQVQSIYNFNLKLINTFKEDYIVLNESDLK